MLAFRRRVLRVCSIACLLMRAALMRIGALLRRTTRHATTRGGIMNDAVLMCIVHTQEECARIHQWRNAHACYAAHHL